MKRANTLHRIIRGMRRFLGPLCLTALVAGCNDREPAERKTMIAGPVKASAARITPDELRRRNSMSFLGAMGTEFMTATTKRMIATRRMPRTKDLCADAKRFFRAHQRAEWKALSPEVKELALGGVCQTLTPIVNKTERKRVHAASLQEHDPDYDVGPAFHTAVDNMVTEASQASDLNDLASRYAVILASSQGMRWIDSIGVEVMLGLAMSQAEYFWDGSVLQSYIDQVQSDFTSCQAGTGNDVYIELDENRILECDGGQMWETQRRSSRSRPQIRLAVYDPTSRDPFRYAAAIGPIPDCSATKSQRIWRAFNAAMIGGGIGFTAGSIAGAIGGSAGGVAGAIAGAKTGGATGGAVGVITGGLAGVIYQAGDYVYCLWAT